MRDSSVLIAKTLLQQVVPCSVRSGQKSRDFCFFLMGVGVAVLLLAVPSGGAQHLPGQEQTISMVGTPFQRQFASGPRTWQSRSSPSLHQGFPMQKWTSSDGLLAMRPYLVPPRCVQVSATTPARDLDKLLSQNAGKLKELRSITVGQGEEYDDLWLLRFILGNPDDLSAAKAAAESALKWRKGEGKTVVDAAKEAYIEATKGGGWNNKAAFDRAPNAAAISPFISPDGSHIFTVPTEWGDLCSVIRAPAIDDEGLMQAVSVKQLTDFFVYVKELNALVCNERTRSSRSICQVISANDLNGVLRLPASGFGEALSRSSKQSVALYPLLAGPTLLLNLPTVVQILVDKLFKPLFPQKVQAKIRFESGPLKELHDLKELRDPKERAKFLSQIDTLRPSLRELLKG